MPAYIYRCNQCGRQRRIERTMEASGEPVSCDSCGGDCRRVWGVTGFLGRAMTTSDARRSSEVLQQRHPGVLIQDCVIDSCGTGIGMGPGTSARIDGLTITNTPTGIEMGDGAQIDARRVRYNGGSRKMQ